MSISEKFSSESVVSNEKPRSFAISFVSRDAKVKPEPPFGR